MSEVVAVLDGCVVEDVLLIFLEKPYLSLHQSIGVTGVALFPWNFFRYVHSSSYLQAQRAFEAAKAIHDIDGIASILLYNPYHLDSLINMAEYYKFSGEQQISAELISKCSYALECAWNPMFTPLQGNCQLKYSHETNKPLFTVPFTHLRNMDRRGCHRSALEVCKLLLSLDSDDPMGAMFCIDYFSSSAEEYAWLEEGRGVCMARTVL